MQSVSVYNNHAYVLFEMDSEHKNNFFLLNRSAEMILGLVLVNDEQTPPPPLKK